MANGLENWYAPQAGPLIGLLQTNPNPAIAELAGVCGYDFIIFDGEHGTFADKDYVSSLHAVSSTKIQGWIRLRDHDAKAVGRYLDWGAHGLVAPNVVNAREARALVRAAKYPPAGTRSFAAFTQRETRYGSETKKHLASCGSSPFFVALIESRLGVENIEEIASVDGIDAVVVGPSDLSADLGHLGDFKRQSYLSCVDRVEKAAHAQGKVLGTVLAAHENAAELLARGYRFFIVGADIAMISSALRAQRSQALAGLGLDDSLQ